jgi:hypothetical protein
MLPTILWTALDGTEPRWLHAIRLAASQFVALIHHRQLPGDAYSSRTGRRATVQGGGGYGWAEVPAGRVVVVNTARPERRPGTRRAAAPAVHFARPSSKVRSLSAPTRSSNCLAVSTSCGSRKPRRQAGSTQKGVGSNYSAQLQLPRRTRFAAPWPSAVQALDSPTSRPEAMLVPTAASCPP